MSCYFIQNGDTEVSIPRYIESTAGIIYYEINVRVQKVCWVVERRYKEFDQMNEKLVEEIAISRKLLPPKKLVGNKNPAFLEQRREELEKYLQELLVFFCLQLPRVVAEFLDFNKYDIIYLLQDLAILFKENGDEFVVNGKKEFTLSALEVFAISERLNLPCPPESIEQRGKFDFSHVLDFCTQLETLIVVPVKNTSGVATSDYNTVDVPIGRSNIIPKNLCFNLNAFRNLKTLKFYGISMENIIDIALLKPTLSTICVHNTTITRINQVLICDNLHKDLIAMSSLSLSTNCSSPSTAADVAATTRSSICENNTREMWQQIEELNFTGNLLTQIDSSVRMAPQLRQLVLEQNRIKGIQNLAGLSQLQVLSLSVNLITDCHDWHLELGNLVTLNLAQNRIKKLSGLRKLLSLVNLDLSCNQIEQLQEVDYVAGLPLLETLGLTGNPLAGSVDYRPRVLARFHERAGEILLDNERASQRELDTALVLSALHKCKLRQSANNKAH